MATMTTIRSQCPVLMRDCGITLFLETAEPRSEGPRKFNGRHGNNAQADSVFSGISTFGRIKYHPCLSSRDVKYDIAFIGTAHVAAKSSKHLTSLQAPRSTLAPHTALVLASGPAALDKVLAASISSMFPHCSRMLTFAPGGHEGSRRVGFSGGYNVPLDANPFNSWAKVLDCGDIPVTS